MLMFSVLLLWLLLICMFGMFWSRLFMEIWLKWLMFLLERYIDECGVV